MRGQIRWSVKFCVLLGFSLTAATMVPMPLPAGAAPASPYALVAVDGAPLGGVAVAAPYTLNPAFSPATTDYYVACHAGSNELSLTLTGSEGPISVSTNQAASPAPGASVNISLEVAPNQAIVLYAPSPGGVAGTTQYWVRCIPPDFPALQVNQAGPASPGWTPGYYYTGNLATANGVHYAMVLDGNGVPVWYQKLPTGDTGPSNVEPLSNDTIAWSPNAGPGFGAGDNISAYTGFDLSTQTTIASLPAAVTPTDPHELTPLPNGDRMMISTPLMTKDLTTLGNGVGGASSSEANNTVVDCVVQEVNPSNQAVWTWDAQTHIGLDETNTLSGLPFAGPAWGLGQPDGVPAADIYHCNSVAVDEDSSSPYFGDVLVSMRHLNAVFLIDRTTGNVVWKLGGTAFTSHDPETTQDVPAQRLAITGDSETQFCGQHDARLVPTPNPAVEDVSVYDDHTNCGGAARGVEYALDLGAGTATPDWQYAQPDGLAAAATGSFRRTPDGANDIGSGSSVIGWGFSVGFPSGFTEVDSSGHVLCDIRFAVDGLYRAIKVDASQVNLQLLRQTAGWTGTTIPPPPSSPPGPVSGGTTLNNAVLGMAATPDGWGYWQVASDGGVFSYGDAGFYGSAGGAPLNKPVVGMAATPDGGGYWLVASDGGVFSYGDAAFYGSAGGAPLNKPVADIAATPDGGGYWLVAADGGVFSYGDAQFSGSAGGAPLNKPVVDIAATPDGGGYWLVASDGGVFSYGDAGYYGSAGGTRLNKPVVGLAATPDGGGYWLVASDGGIFNYGGADFYGSAVAG
ncbi:MAG TPA: aryl-sulfate sulfotransferase [Acidimicrobiales bacterium]|nr:aryl-sulfate sulfotransferase [Acidimicrobiales bacterium]